MPPLPKWAPYAAAALLALGGYWYGKHSVPSVVSEAAKREVVTAVIYASHEEFAERRESREDMRRTREWKPDGTVIEVLERHEAATVDLTLRRDEVGQLAKVEHEEVIKTVKTDAADRFMVAATVSGSVTDLKPVYGAMAGVRLIGPVWLGAQANTAGLIGAWAGVSF